MCHAVAHCDVPCPEPSVLRSSKTVSNMSFIGMRPMLNQVVLAGAHSHVLQCAHCNVPGLENGSGVMCAGAHCDVQNSKDTSFPSKSVLEGATIWNT